MNNAILAVIATVTIAGATATALFVGGSPTAIPTSIRTPVTIGEYSKMSAIGLQWDASPAATGYRLYLDGIAIGLVNGSRLSTSITVSCGIRHRFNSQPFNNKGFAPLAPPVYFTTDCAKATP